MTDSNPPGDPQLVTPLTARRSEADRLRRWLPLTCAASANVWVFLTVASYFAGGSLGLMLGVVATTALVAASASLLAWMLMPGYIRDIEGVRRLHGAIGYFTRATTYGIAAAGAGVLLSEALPRGLAVPIAADLQSLSVSGVVVVGFGVTGATLGILEQWRRGEIAVRAGDPSAAGPPTLGRTNVGGEEPRMATATEDSSLKALDRWVLTASTLIAIAFIAASVVRPENASVYLSALGWLGALDIGYFVFGR